MTQRILLDYKGRKVKGYRIRVCSDFPAHMDKIWNKIQDIETLRYIANPWAQFDPVSDIPQQWREGDKYIFQVRMHDIIPIGKHTIHVMEMNRAKGEIYTNEYDDMVKIWNHRIIMENKGNDTTSYMDIVDIYAGIFTRIVAWWSVKYYRHRQKKWKLMAKDL